MLRKLRRRSLARLRKEVEPVEPESLARFLGAWQHITTTRGGPRGVDGVLTVVDQLAGCAVPASALESLVLPSRVRDYEPAFLDELTSSGEVLWAGHAALPGSDGWVSLHLADQAPLTLPEPEPVRDTPSSTRPCSTRSPPEARGSSASSRDAVGSTNDGSLSAALWDLVWAGRVGNDTLAPLRALTRSGTTAHRSRRPPPRIRAAGRMPARTGPPETAGRWALLPALDTDPTRRGHAAAEHLLDRHGVVIRGRRGQRAAPGRLRRGLQGAVGVRGLRPLPPRLLRGRPRRRAVRHRRRHRPAPHVRRGRPRREADRGRAGRDRPGQPLRRRPALAGPGRRRRVGERSGHRPGRKAGALVVLVDGHLTLYVERGGRTLLTWADDPALLAPAAESLAEAARRGSLGRLTVEKADGEQLLGAGTDPAPGRPPGRRLPVDTEGTPAPCLRATPSGAPRGPSTGRSPDRCSPRTDFRVPQLATADLTGGTVRQTALARASTC